MTPRALRDALLDYGWETPPGKRHTSLSKGSAFALLEWDWAEEWYWSGNIELPDGGVCAVAWNATDDRWRDIPADGWHSPDTWHELADIVEAMEHAAQGMFDEQESGHGRMRAVRLIPALKMITGDPASSRLPGDDTVFRLLPSCDVSLSCDNNVFSTMDEAVAAAEDRIREAFADRCRLGHIAAAGSTITFSREKRGDGCACISGATDSGMNRGRERPGGLRLSVLVFEDRRPEPVQPWTWDSLEYWGRQHIYDEWREEYEYGSDTEALLSETAGFARKCVCGEMGNEDMLVWVSDMWSDGPALLAVEIISCLIDLNRAPRLRAVLAMPEGLRKHVEVEYRS